MISEFQNFGEIVPGLKNILENNNHNPFIYIAKSGIKIKNKNKGKFTKYCGGNVTDECILRGKNSSNPSVRKLATFADNARKWKHLNGGVLYAAGGSSIKLSKYIKSNKREDEEPLFSISSLFDIDYGEMPDLYSRVNNDTSEEEPKDVFDLNTLVSNGSTTSVRTPFNISEDIQKSIDYIKSNATPYFSKDKNGWCGRAVGKALLNGGFNVRQADGHNYHDEDILSRGGFDEIYTGNGADESLWSGNYTPEAGDVVVFEKNNDHNLGHVAMYTGNDGWYSDFKQNSFHGYADPKTVGKYHIYRKHKV